MRSEQRTSRGSSQSPSVRSPSRACAFAQSEHIGGVNSSNIRRILHGAISSSGLPLDGVAVISGIISAQDIKTAASDLAKEILAFRSGQQARLSATPSFNFEFAPLYEKVRKSHALIQQITNVRSPLCSPRAIISEARRLSYKTTRQMLRSLSAAVLSVRHVSATHSGVESLAPQCRPVQRRRKISAKFLDACLSTSAP